MVALYEPLPQPLERESAPSIAVVTFGTIAGSSDVTASSQSSDPSPPAIPFGPLFRLLERLGIESARDR